jgi:hypothetical protein
LIFGEIEMRFEPFAPRGIVAARTQRADIERRRSDRFHQREIVELRVVRERDHGATLVEFHVENGVVRHLAHERRARQMPHVGIFLARIAHGDLIVESKRDLAEILRELACADHEHPVTRAMNGQQDAAVEIHAVG